MTNGKFSLPRRRPRSWWQAGVIGVGLLGALIAARLLWQRVADHLLDQEISAIEQRHEPIRPEDFDPRRVVDPARNAAVPIGQAAALIIYTPAENRWAAGFTGQLPLSPYDLRTLSSIRTTNQRSLDMARSARLTFPGVDWGVRVRQPVSSPAWRPTFNAERKLATLLCNVALLDASTGRPTEALEHIRDTLFLSRALESKGPLPDTHFSAVGVATLACQTLDQLAPTLPPDTRPQLHALISELLDEDSVDAGLIRALQGRRMYDLSAADDLSRALFRDAGFFALRPMIRLDTLRALRADSATITAVTAPTYPAASQLLPPARSTQPAPHLADITRTYSTLTATLSDAHIRAQYLHLLDRRLTATSLAIHLYRLDHDGHFPPTLSALVPDYLPSLPTDPLAPDNAPLGYIATRTPPILYSVGLNGADDHGDHRPYNPKYPNAPRTLRYDIVYPLRRHLTENSTPSTPHTQPLPESPPAPPPPASPN